MSCSSKLTKRARQERYLSIGRSSERELPFNFILCSQLDWLVISLLKRSFISRFDLWVNELELHWCTSQVNAKSYEKVTNFWIPAEAQSEQERQKQLMANKESAHLPLLQLLRRLWGAAVDVCRSLLVSFDSAKPSTLIALIMSLCYIVWFLIPGMVLQGSCLVNYLQHFMRTIWWFKA